MINPELRGLRQQAQAAGEQKTTLSSTHCCPAPYTEARLVPQVPWVQGLQGSPRSLVGQGSHPTDMAPWEGSQWWDRWRSCWHRRGLPPACLLSTPAWQPTFAIVFGAGTVEVSTSVFLPQTSPRPF